MGVSAELYVSGNDQEAAQYDLHPESFPDCERYRGFTDLELSTLWAKLRGTPWDVALMDEFPNILLVDGGERSIHRLPSAMVIDVANLTPTQISSLSAQWAATDELRCRPEDVQPIIEGLVRLAQKAVHDRRNIYFYNAV